MRTNLMEAHSLEVLLVARTNGDHTHLQAFEINTTYTIVAYTIFIPTNFRAHVLIFPATPTMGHTCLLHSVRLQSVCS